MKAILFVQLLLTAFYFISCNGKDSEGGYAARVEDTYLSEEEVSHLSGRDTLLRNYYIKNWIETEVFYKQGLEEDITDDKELSRILENNRKEIIKAYLIRKLLDERDLNPSDDELEDFYNQNREAFKLKDDAFVIDMIEFSNMEIASRFREMVLNFNWENAQTSLENDKSVLRNIKSEVLYDFQLSQGNFLRILELMQEGEVSLVFQENPGRFLIARIIKKLNREDIPEAEYIMKDIRKLYRETKQREYIDEYTKNLYSKFDIEIRDKEK